MYLELLKNKFILAENIISQDSVYSQTDSFSWIGKIDKNFSNLK